MCYAQPECTSLLQHTNAHNRKAVTSYHKFGRIPIAVKGFVVAPVPLFRQLWYAWHRGVGELVRIRIARGEKAGYSTCVAVVDQGIGLLDRVDLIPLLMSASDLLKFRSLE